MSEFKKGLRALISGYHGMTVECEVLEVSPSGKYVKLLRDTECKWFPVGVVEVIEVLPPEQPFSEIPTYNSSSPALHDVVFERMRQIENYPLSHDDAHDAGELSGAGAALALNASCLIHPQNGTPLSESSARLRGWPEDWEWIGSTKPHGARRDLVKACALLLAEIERFDRLTPAEQRR